MIQSNKKGFTLVELFVALGICGILAAIAIPAYLGMEKKKTINAVAEKEMLGLDLSPNEMILYKDNKEQVEENANRKVKRSYFTRDGNLLSFNISRKELDEFGYFSSEDRIETPRGIATVIGIYGGELWFHIDGDRGASFWKGYRKVEFFSGKFKLLKTARERQLSSNRN